MQAKNFADGTYASTIGEIVVFNARHITLTTVSCHRLSISFVLVASSISILPPFRIRYIDIMTTNAAEFIENPESDINSFEYEGRGSIDDEYAALDELLYGRVNGTKT